MCEESEKAILTNNKEFDMKISKEFKFEMAHKLKESYTCKCQNIHGHSYRAIVSLESEKLGNNDVVVDFTKVKELIGELFDVLDHALMVRESDEITSSLLLPTLAGYNKKLILCNGEPTAENIALWLAFKIEHLLEDLNLSHFSIKLFETATSCAEVSQSDLIGRFEPLMKFVGFHTNIEFLNSLGVSVVSKAFKGGFEGFEELYYRNLNDLIDYSLKKFYHHRNKGDWIKNKEKMSFDNLFREFLNEVEELRGASNTQDFNFEAGDCLNYLIILNSLKYNFLKGN